MLYMLGTATGVYTHTNYLHPALLKILDIVREFFGWQVRLFVTYERQA